METNIYICSPCRHAIASSEGEVIKFHNCPEWDKCECPSGITWCVDCGEYHHEYYE